MTPIKSGVHIYLAEYDIYYVGDLWQEGGVFIAKCNPHNSREPLRDVLHLKVNELGQYWQDVNFHYIICRTRPTNEYLGYHGVSLAEAFRPNQPKE